MFLNMGKREDSDLIGRNRRIVIAAMPEGRLTLEHFRTVEDDIPNASEGDLLVAVRLISIDAANRAWMQGLTYRSALSDGTTMAGLAIGEVVESRDADFAPGDLVFGDLGWQTYAAVPAAQVVRQERIEPLSHLLSLYGTSTLTAYYGLTHVGDLVQGETLLVSAAGGSVGIMVSQIGRAMGARVIGIAGGAEKCEWLVKSCGLEAAIDYHNEDVRQSLKRYAPDGIDVFFDNVGGEILDGALFAMRLGGRIVCCGAVSGYDGAKPISGPRGVPGLLITKRLTMRGFIVDDYRADHAAVRDKICDWARTGKVHAVEDIIYGLEEAPNALIRQLAGRNRGKQIIRI